MTENTANIVAEQTEGIENVTKSVNKHGIVVIAIGMVAAGLVGFGVHLFKKHHAKKVGEEVLEVVDGFTTED